MSRENGIFDDGGPAFPRPSVLWPSGHVSSGSEGMSLLDYFAIHSTQPGVSEIVAAAGLQCPDNFNVYSYDGVLISTFNKWWATLTNEQRFTLSSKVKYQEASAMIAARSIYGVKP